MPYYVLFGRNLLLELQFLSHLNKRISNSKKNKQNVMKTLALLQCGRHWNTYMAGGGGVCAVGKFQKRVWALKYTSS